MDAHEHEHEPQALGTLEGGAFIFCVPCGQNLGSADAYIEQIAADNDALLDTLAAQQERIAKLERALIRIRRRARNWIYATDLERPSRYSLMSYDIEVANEVLDDKAEAPHD